ncbi:MAG: YhcN/YlaJ family sporulation lipoprotein [Clostridia bacterium]|nr:YhcN/YlaJ family sporulation lipoprotein [Clostridia bacterium]
MMKKSILLVLAVSAALVVLAGCSLGNTDTMGSTKAPEVTFTPAATMTPLATIAPAGSMAPESSPMGTAGGMTNAATGDMANSAAGGAAASMTPAEAGKTAEKIAEAVERISEIDDAEVIVRDNRALVAVEFDDQYSAGLDERMKQLITETVQKGESAITEVSITDDNTLYGQVKSLAERIGKATGFDELADDIGDLWSRVTGM